MKMHSVLALCLGVLLGATFDAAAQDVVNSSMTITMDQAIALAIKNNLTAKLSKGMTEQARGQAIQAAASLLPQITGTVEQDRTFKVNLEAQGFPANNPIFSPLLGPFNTFDARVKLVQTILDFNALWVRQAARANSSIAAAQEHLAREQVATAAALAYLEDQRTRRAVNAAQVDESLSESLRRLAYDQHESGVATGVDVARSQTDKAQSHLRLIQAQVAAQQADLKLKRVLGVALSQPISLPDIPRVAQPDSVSPDQGIGLAQHDRAEIQIAAQSVTLADDQLKSTKASYAPTLKAVGDYGYSGTTPDNVDRTGKIGGILELPIFNGGDRYGQLVASRALKQEAQDRLTDIQQQVQEDVLLALQTLGAELDETKTADQAVGLAQIELKMARDRYSAGVGDNIQLLTAQASLSRALDDQINAFARFDTARVNLATALGHAQEFK